MLKLGTEGIRIGLTGTEKWLLNDMGELIFSN